MSASDREFFVFVLFSLFFIIPAVPIPFMNRDKLRYLVDLCLAVSFVLCFFTGVARFPGFLRAIGILGIILPIRDLSLIHDWSGVAMGGMVMIHLALNYRWIAGMTRAIIEKR